MRILATSDLHCDVAATKVIAGAAGAADVVVIVGDLATRGEGAGPLLELLKTISRPVILVPGNHDGLAEMRSFCSDWRDGHVLHGDGLRLRDIPFFGLGAEIPRANDEVWNFAMSEAKAAAALASCPVGAVLLTHSPPKGLCDRQNNGRHEGSTAVTDVLRTKAPRLHLCGHIHASFGQSDKLGDCPVHNLGPTVNWFTV
ncbi:MAG: metallophosphoesterase family protein [Sulfitobacter sp.]